MPERKKKYIAAAKLIALNIQSNQGGLRADASGVAPMVIKISAIMDERNTALIAHGSIIAHTAAYITHTATNAA